MDSLFWHLPCPKSSREDPHIKVASQVADRGLWCNRAPSVLISSADSLFKLGYEPNKTDECLL